MYTVQTGMSKVRYPSKGVLYTVADLGLSKVLYTAVGEVLKGCFVSVYASHTSLGTLDALSNRLKLALSPLAMSKTQSMRRDFCFYFLFTYI